MQDFAKQYFDLLNGDFAGINLTRIKDFDDFYNKQILDSVIPLEQSQTFQDAINSHDLYIDVGFGGGFPILPLAHRLPKKSFIGIETRKKKCDVVGQIADRLKISNVSFQHARIENVLIDKEAVVSFKAVGKVNDFLLKLNPSTKIKVFFYKGPGFYDLEKDQIELAKKEWNIICEDELVVPGTEKRYLIGFENKNVLRGTKDIKQLVKVSDIK
jgi:16S rRNA (guanine527-N7)-methyltransferase